jgi:hypothetical protein
MTGLIPINSVLFRTICWQIDNERFVSLRTARENNNNGQVSTVSEICNAGYPRDWRGNSSLRV